MSFLLETLRLGLANLRLHKLRSLLTALGIIIGIAAVVAIAAYGEGAKLAALEDIRQLGVKNIILRSVKPPESQTTQAAQRMIAYGLLWRDVRRIEGTVPYVERIVPLKEVGGQVTQGIYTAPARVFGTEPALLDTISLRIARGRYLTEQDMNARDPVAVVGWEVAERLFPLEDPLSSTIRIDEQTFRVVGVMGPVGLAGGAGTALVGRDLNFDIHIPMTSAVERFGDMQVKRTSGSMEITQVELSEVIVRVTDESRVQEVADQIKRITDLEHSQQRDVTAIVPLELLRQAERTQLMFNVLMIIIAGLSLLVGGIGIMNIMLASVTERTREIGIRRALGATRKHIIAQFLVETTVLSGLGGVVGVLLGLLMTLGIAVAHHFVEALEEPRVTQWSIVVSFLVATGVGIVFGLYPAIKAANQDPIVALRHD